MKCSFDDILCSLLLLIFTKKVLKKALTTFFSGVIYFFDTLIEEATLKRLFAKNEQTVDILKDSFVLIFYDLLTLGI